MAREQQLTEHDRAVSNAVLVPDQAKAALAKFWKDNSKQIAAVTAGTDTERIMRVTYSLLYRTPTLIRCTPFSLLNSIVLAHQLGLVLGTQEAAVVPFGAEATLIIQYQGKIKLALGSKLVTAIHTDVVLEGEEFVYEVTAKGLRFKHKPVWAARPRANEGNTIGAYCQLTGTNGGVTTKFVPLSEILDARNRSRGYQYQVKKNGKDNAWFSDFGAMAMKTAIHRCMKLAPQDARLGLACAVDDEEEGSGAVLAEGLSPVDFSDRDLKQPLVETGRDAAQAVAQAKLAAAEVTDVERLPDAIEHAVGTRMRCKGELWVVEDAGEEEGYRWMKL